MTALAFDSLKTARTLESRGFSREQAEAVAEVVAESRAIDVSHLATRDDLKHEITAVRADMQASEHRLEQKIDGVKHELEQKIDGVKHELEQKISESQVSTQRFILTTFLSAAVLNAVMILGAMFGLAKLLGH